MKSDLLNDIIACPSCLTDLSITNSQMQVTCGGCQSTFRKEAFAWSFIPDKLDLSSPLWKAWQHVQENGWVSYLADPEHNLSVGNRIDCQQFAKFCRSRGLVLDVGCGPQAWPAYFDPNREAVYVGIDPLIGDSPGDYLKLKALGEFLPFRAHVFDHVLFSTTLDHMVDPVAALKAAARVCKPNGDIDVWIGEKRPDAPKPATSPEWYCCLEKPLLAEDVFHIKRLDVARFLELVQAASLSIVETESHRRDEYRTNFFYRLRAG